MHTRITSPARRFPRLLAGLLLAGVTLPVASCNIIGPIGYVVHGPEKVQKLYELDPKKVTAVFIDDASRSVLPTRAVRRKIGEVTENRLLNELKIDHMIASQDLIAVADRERYSKQMKIDEIGAAVNAEIIIYVSMQAFALVQDKEQFKPLAGANVRVIDVKEKKQLFPEKMEEAYTLRVECPPHNGTLPKGTSERTAVQMELAQRIGNTIADMFISHTKIPEAGLLDH